MPTCGTQVILCDVPIRFDTYRGCSHGCEYCFAARKTDMDRVECAEGPSDLRAWIGGKRELATCWCDGQLPIHWGGLSDPFQPCEQIHQRSLKCLRVFADSKYPVVFSTKGAIVASPEYLEVLRNCSAVAQVSLVAPSYNAKEPGAPPYAERIRMVAKLASACERVIARIQPLFINAVASVCEQTLPQLRDTGCFGVTVEGYKSVTAQAGMVRLGGDHVYPLHVIRPALEDIRESAHRHGLRFYAAENRLRSMGDSLTCCGCDDLAGFEANRCNLNHLFYGGYATTPQQEKSGTGDVFAAIPQDAGSHQMCRPVPFARLMEEMAKVRPLREMMGVEQVAEQMGLFAPP